MCASDEARQRVMAIMEGSIATEPQSSAAKRMYDARASSYDDSWHPSFARDFVAQLPLQRGARVLDLACGTGLLTFQLAERVGPEGAVVGVDISPGMLAVARQKLRAGAAPPTATANNASSTSTDLLIDLDASSAEPPPPPPDDPDRWKHVQLYEHSITDLDSLPALAAQKGSFDAITIASALVLLPDPEAAIAHWLPYLRPGGLLALDVPHPQNLVAGALLERVGRRMGVPVPYHRGWVLDAHSLPDLLARAAGLEVVSNNFVPQAGYGERVLPATKAEMERQFAALIASEAGKAFGANRGPKWEEARILFCEEWLLEAGKNAGGDGGGVREVDGVWVTVARKPPLAGSCRCGEVRYTAASVPRTCNMCHCRTCQKLSGGPGQPFVAVKVGDVTWLEDSERALRRTAFSGIAVRAFCTRCGTPVFMRYRAKEGGELKDEYWFSLATVDEGLPEGFKVQRHIFLEEKQAWEVLPEDGAERWKRWVGD